MTLVSATVNICRHCMQLPYAKTSHETAISCLNTLDANKKKQRIYGSRAIKSVWITHISVHVFLLGCISINSTFDSYYFKKWKNRLIEITHRVNIVRQSGNEFGPNCCGLTRLCAFVCTCSALDAKMRGKHEVLTLAQLIQSIAENVIEFQSGIHSYSSQSNM